MHYCEYHCNLHHLSLVVSTQNETYIRQVLSSQNPQLLHLWNDSDIYPSFLSGSIQFFVFTLLFLVSLLISSLWRGHFSALLLLSVLRHCLQFGLERIWPGESRHCSCAGEGLPAEYARKWLTLLRHAPWLWLVVLRQEQWIHPTKLGPLGGATDSWSASYSTVRSWWQF